MVICVFPTNPAKQIASMDEAEIQLLAVYPHARGQGIATAPIGACEQYALSGGYTRFVLFTQPTMKDAHRLYERLGYKRTPERDWTAANTGKTYLVYEKRFLTRHAATLG
jgi:GNAT superfamily N-acetyltransferase